MCRLQTTIVYNFLDTYYPTEEEKKKVVTECIEPEMKTKPPTKVAAQTEKEVQQLVKEVNEKIVKLNKERAKIRDIEPEQLSLDELKDRFSKDLVKKLKKIQDKAQK